MVAHNRRRLPDLKRATTYLPEDDWKWLTVEAEANGWTISRFLAEVVRQAHDKDRKLLREMREEEALWQDRR